MAIAELRRRSRFRRRKAWLVLSALVLAGPLAATAAGQTGPPAGARAPAVPQEPTLDEFLGAIVNGNLITARSGGPDVVEDVAPQTPQEPFGGDSGASEAAQDAATLTQTFTFGYNPGQAWLQGDANGDGTLDLVGDVGRVTIPLGDGEIPRDGQEIIIDYVDGDPDTDPLAGTIYNDGYLPPYNLPPAGGPPPTMNGIVNDLGLDPNDPGIQSFAGQDVIIVNQPGMGDVPITGSVIVWGGRTEGMLPLTDCGGLVRELVLGADGRVNWVPAGFAPLDIFAGTANDIAVTCDNGWAINRFTNQGSSFGTASTPSAALIGDQFFVGITPTTDLPDATGLRVTGFATDRDNQYQPGGTAFTSHPANPGLSAAPPFFINNHFPGQTGPFPVDIQFDAVNPFESGSPCGPESWQATFEGYFGDPGPDGTGEFNLVQVASGQHTHGTYTYDAAGNLIAESHAQVVTPDFAYNESVFIGPDGNLYIYQPGGVPDDDCRFNATFGPGGADFLAGAPPPLVIDTGGGSDTIEGSDTDPAVTGDSGTSDSGTGDSSSDSGGSSGDTPGPESGIGIVTDPATGGGGLGLGEILGGIGALTFLTGGALYVNEKKKQTVATTAVDDDPLPGLDDEEPAPVATVAEPPAVREHSDSFIRFLSAEEAEWELNEADRARWKVLQDADATAAWSAAQAAEARIQEQLRSMVSTAATDLGEGITDFSGAVQTYGTAMSTLLSESDEIGMLYNEWTKKGGVKDIMWWVDLADAVVGLTRLVISLGTGATKLVIRLMGSGDEAADAVRGGEAVVEGTEAVTKIDDAAEAVPSYLKGSESDAIYAGKEGNIGELENFLVRVLGRQFDDYAEALPAAATKLGYYMGFSDAARQILLRLAAQARIAAKGGKPAFSADDLARLQRAGQDPQFWRNLENGAALDHGNRVYRMFDDQEIWWLWNLAGRPEAARAAGSIPHGPLRLPDFPIPGAPAGGLGSATPTALDIGRVTPPGSGTGVFPDALTLPHINPNAIDPNAATIGGGSVLTLPPPPGTGVFDGALTLPHTFQPLPQGWNAAETVIDGFRPLAQGFEGADTVLDAGRIGGQPWQSADTVLEGGLDLARPGQAAANPSGLGGLTAQPPGGVAPPAPPGGADVVQTGVGGGQDVSSLSEKIANKLRGTP